MAAEGVGKEFYESSKLAKYQFEPYWPAGKLRICVTGAGGFIASHLAKRLKSEGHYIIGVDWKRNEHMPVCLSCGHNRARCMHAGISSCDEHCCLEAFISGRSKLCMLACAVLDPCCYCHG